MAQWLERLASTLRDPGSIPGGGEILGSKICFGSTTVYVASRKPQYAKSSAPAPSGDPKSNLPQGGLGISCFFGQRSSKKQEIPNPRVPWACATGRQWALISPLGPPLFMGGQSYSLHVEQRSLLSCWHWPFDGAAPSLPLPGGGFSSQGLLDGAAFAARVFCRSGLGLLAASGPRLICAAAWTCALQSFIAARSSLAAHSNSSSLLAAQVRHCSHAAPRGVPPQVTCLACKWGFDICGRY